MKPRLPILLLTLACSLGFGSAVTSFADEKPVIYVPVPPYAGLVESLVGDLAEVRSIASENDDPHIFSPTPKELAKLSVGTIYFAADLPFEETLVTKLNESKSKVKIVSLVEGLDRRTFGEGEHDCDHEHGHDHDDHGHDHAEHKHDHDDHGHDHAELKHDHDDHRHDHAEHKHDHDDHGHDHAEHDHGHHGHDHGDGELDPHVWLSPAHLVEQIRTIQAEVEPLFETEEAKSTIQENSRKLVQQLRDTDRELAEKLAPFRDQSFYVYHGAFGYFADAYGLSQVPVELSGRTPEPRQIAAMIDKAKEEGVSVIFVQPQFDQSSAKAIAESIGGIVVPIDPLKKDVISNLKHIASEITASKSSS
ncbi:MAG: zinc ABC transporter substrate-binding protein [Verrucomicrobiales bacterium]|nr:zinc ABC transporter substrate-binding protein [Verrucomicrobiales bacterium]